jgi:hypothetical protein
MKVYKYYTNAVSLQDGANSAFQEAVGDSVMYGVMAPQHLQRLGLINDTSQGNFIKNYACDIYINVLLFQFFRKVSQANKVFCFLILTANNTPPAGDDTVAFHASYVLTHLCVLNLQRKNLRGLSP